MNKTLLVMALFCNVVYAKAQSSTWDLNVYGGYTFRDKVNLYDNYAYINAGFQYGGGVEFHLDNILALELKYIRMDTEVPLYKNNNGGEQLNPDSSKAALNYILLSTNIYSGNEEAKLIPFGSGAVGVGIADAKKGGSVTKFAWELTGGVKIKTQSAVSIKLQAYLRSVSGGYGGTFYMGSGGVIYGSYDYVSIWQFGLGGGLCFNLGYKKKK